MSHPIVACLDTVLADMLFFDPFLAPGINNVNPFRASTNEAKEILAASRQVITKHPMLPRRIARRALRYYFDCAMQTLHASPNAEYILLELIGVKWLRLPCPGRAGFCLEARISMATVSFFYGVRLSLAPDFMFWLIY